MAVELQTDGEGNILLKPVAGYATGILGEIAILLKVEYRRAEHEKATQSIQFVLTPQIALGIAAKLTELSQKILQPAPEKRPM